jgi:hypothetical protein
MRNAMKKAYLLLTISVLFFMSSDLWAQNRPKVMVIIPEHHISRPIPDPAGETEIIKTFISAGYKVVDQQQTAQIRYNDQVAAALKGNNKLASKIGMEHGADLIVIGEAFSESAGQVLSGFITCRARIEAKVIRTDNAEILAADGKYASGLDVAEFVAGKKAIQKAAHELGKYFIEQLSVQWSGPAASKTEVDMVVLGVDYGSFIQFKNALGKSSRAVSEVTPRSFTNGRGVLEVYTKGTAYTLAEELTGKGVPGFKVRVDDVTTNRLTILLN